ncbi:MAG: hypothetical protein LBH61_03915 [Dysgonamonadaceae bacterium]|jgi:hypothetical protein|nr:hypothetical protein [Dysgonamonadaceae bacterium]
MNIKKLLRVFDFREDEPMVKLLKKTSGLPMNLYLDEWERNTLRYGARLKFQPNTKDRIEKSEKDFYTMSISDNPEIKKKSKLKNELSSKDIELLKRWIIANKALLLQLAINSEDPIDMFDFYEKSIKANELV